MYYNYYMNKPYIQAHKGADSVMVSTVFEEKDKMQALEELSFESFVEQSKNWLKNGKIVALAAGNITPEVSEEIMRESAQILNLNPIGFDSVPAVRPASIQPN